MAKKSDCSGWSKGELVKEIEALRKCKTYGLMWDEESTKEELEEDSWGKQVNIKKLIY